MEEVEAQLRKQAEILGNLNLQLNKFVEQNQQLSLQIVKLEQRITKKVQQWPIKKKTIEQEGKDKAIIQSKLGKAEDKKKQLQIEAQGNEHQEIETKTPEPEIKRPQFLDKPAKKQQKEKEAKKQEKAQESYENGQKGQYQPPLLLEQKQGSQSGSDQNQGEDQNVLQSIRSKLEHLGKDQDDDD